MVEKQASKYLQRTQSITGSVVELQQPPSKANKKKNPVGKRREILSARSLEKKVHLKLELDREAWREAW